jgi:hypothetical protein
MQEMDSPTLFPSENIYQNLHFKKIKKSKKRKLTKSDFLKTKKNISLFTRVETKKTKNENNLFPINEKEEIRFEDKLINSFSQKIGFYEHFPTKEYFRNIPYTCHSQIPVSLPMPYPRYGPVQYPNDFQMNHNNVLGKRSSYAFNPIQPLQFSINQFNNTYFQNNQPFEQINNHKLKSNFFVNDEPIFQKNILSDMSSDSENRRFMNSNFSSSGQPEHGQNDSFKSSLNEKCSHEKSTHFNTETNKNVIFPNEKFQMDNILKNSFLKNLNSTHQKCNFASSIQEVLASFTKNNSIEITKDNILVLLNLQIPINKQIFDSIDIKYRLRIITMLFVKYVNKSAFANVCKPFMEEIEFNNDTKLSKFLKR